MNAHGKWWNNLTGCIRSRSLLPSWLVALEWNQGRCLRRTKTSKGQIHRWVASERFFPASTNKYSIRDFLSWTAKKVPLTISQLASNCSRSCLLDFRQIETQKLVEELKKFSPTREIGGVHHSCCAEQENETFVSKSLFDKTNAPLFYYYRVILTDGGVSASCRHGAFVYCMDIRKETALSVLGEHSTCVLLFVVIVKHWVRRRDWEKSKQESLLNANGHLR